MSSLLLISLSIIRFGLGSPLPNAEVERFVDRVPVQPDLVFHLQTSIPADLVPGSIQNIAIAAAVVGELHAIVDHSLVLIEQPHPQRSRPRHLQLLHHLLVHEG